MRKECSKRNEERHWSSFGDHVRAAELACDLWKSGDRRDWDRALALKSEVIKHNPKAWEYAMREVNTEEMVERRRPPQIRTFQAGEKRGLRASERNGHLELREAPDPYAKKSAARFKCKESEISYLDV